MIDKALWKTVVEICKRAILELPSCSFAARHQPFRTAEDRLIHICLQPLSLRSVGREESITAFDGVQPLQDWVGQNIECRDVHPLDRAHLHRHAGKFRRISVDLDSPDVCRADGWEGRMKSHRSGVEAGSNRRYSPN